MTPLRHERPILVLACEVMREELLLVPRRREVGFRFLPMGLHVAPARLHAAIAAELGRAAAVERVVLGFGLCGNAAAGLSCRAAPLVVPRVHDCIPVLAGDLAPRGGPGLERGTFYLSGGWMEGERTLASEHRWATERFGEAKALRVLARMLDGYARFRFIRTGHPRQGAREREASALAALARLPLEVVEGRRAYLDELVNGPWDPRRFVHVPAGSPVEAEAFRGGGRPAERGVNDACGARRRETEESRA